MRTLRAAVVIAAALVIPSTVAAQERVQLGAFGGLTFGETTSATTFGGTVGAPLSGTLHLVVEGGRVDDVMPSTLGTLIDFTPIDFRLSAWYGEAGLRFVAAPSSAVSPYVEATAGAARLRSRVAGAGGADPFVNTALRVLDQTEPLLGVGGGVVVRGGPLALDLGYRYKKILASDSLQSMLTGGDGLSISQVRVGIGIRF